MSRTDFSRFIKCIRPLQQNKERIEYFTNRIIEIYTPYVDEDKIADIKRSDSTIKKYAYGSDEISKEVALEILRYKDEDSLKEFIDDAEDSEQSAMLDLFSSEFPDEDWNLHNIGIKASKLLTKILVEVSTKDNKKNTPSANVDDFIKKPYIENGMLVIGDSKLPLPIAKTPNNIISEDELKLKYLYALIDAYNDAEDSKIDISNINTLKKKYRENFQEQRVNFYEADCLKTFSRDTLKSNTNEFKKLLDETYDGVINTSRKNYQNGYNRLLAVLEQASLITLSGSQLFTIPGMVNNKRKLGFCHMLVNENRLLWIDEED